MVWRAVSKFGCARWRLAHGRGMLGLCETAQRRVRPWLAHAQPRDLTRPADQWLRLTLDMARRARVGALLAGAPPWQVLSALAVSVAACIGALAANHQSGRMTLIDVVNAADRLDAWLLVADDELDLIDLDAAALAFGPCRDQRRGRVGALVGGRPDAR